MSDLIARAQHEMTVCNACRYCEAYCPVFQAMEERVTFTKSDVLYLANLCHNCGECLYACQYAPPHEFGIDVPKTFSALRVESYEGASWPTGTGAAFRAPWATSATALIISLVLVIVALAFAPSTESAGSTPADFYAVMPHHVMVTVFGIASVFAVLALIIGYRRFSAATSGAPRTSHPAPSNPQSPIPHPQSRVPSPQALAARDVLTLRHLHPEGADCVGNEEVRQPWRRWLHHCTFYGFGLCGASTTVAAAYHLFFGWLAPYGYTSLPVILGTLGGIGLLVGPAGLFLVDTRRDRELTHPVQAALDRVFLLMLFLTSATGLLLLMLREHPVMPRLLVVHLVVVLALFLTLPYGKFVHGIYRAAALVKFRKEDGIGDSGFVPDP